MCEVCDVQRQPRPAAPFRYQGEACSFNQLKVLLTDAALIGFDAEVKMTEDRVRLRSMTRTVSFPRKINPDGVSDVSSEWTEEDHE